MGMLGTGAARARLALFGTLLAMVLTACVPLYRNHGYIPLPEDLAQIQVGVDTRDSVAEKVGTPTALGVLNEGGYYFVQSRFRLYGFLEPVEIERRVLAITFTDSGVVRNIESFGLEDGRVVVLTQRVTEDNIPDRTFIQQLLRNIGNFDAGAIFGEG